jgi:hypothetical protein
LGIAIALNVVVAAFAITVGAMLFTQGRHVTAFMNGHSIRTPAMIAAQ